MEKWVPVFGKISQPEEGKFLFKGGEKVFDPEKNQKGAEMCLVLCNTIFSGGRISATVSFDNPTPKSSFDLVLFYDPLNRYNLNAGIANNPFCAIRHFDSKWTYHASTGDNDVLEANRPYNVSAIMKGSRVRLVVDEVEVLAANLPFTLPQSQVGFWCMDYNGIHVSNFKIDCEKPKIFVIMQFSDPYNSVYEEIIKKVTDELKIDTVRADESVNPGLVIADIAKYIAESKAIIADISPTNPNVYYEVGYAHAVNKPTILIAMKDTKLPFDVSPFRTIFYQDSIKGRTDLENNLRRHLKSVLQER